MLLAAFFYSLSLLCQVFAAAYAINLFFQAKAYRLTCGFLAVGLGLMVGRRISPLLHVLNQGHVNLSDAVLSLPISLFLLLGMFQLKKVLGELEYKNFALDQSTKLDSLTNAMSRLESFSRAQVEIERSYRSKKSIAFMMLDIDYFKNVNDQYGHPVGDIVLMNLVKYCKEQLRSIDILGRVGGEEFLIVLPETTQEQALEVAERLRKYIESKTCAISQGKDIHITVSIGLAMFNPEKEGLSEPAAVLKTFYSACDQAMYRAKQAGRNQVCH